MNVYLVVLICYAAFLVAVGAAISRKVKGAEAFFVADRRLGSGLLFSTLLAANIGAGSTVGAAGLGYAIGLSGWWWVGSAGLGSLILAFTVGPRIRESARRHGLLTVGDFLELRYDATVRATVAGLLWVGTLAILAGQLIAFSWILQVVAGTSKLTGCLLGGGVVIAYFAAGGLRAASWVNLIQLLVKSVGFVIGLPVALATVGGWDTMRQNVLDSAARSTEYFSLVGIGWGEILPYLVLLVPSFIVSPGLLQKIYGGRDDATVRRAVGLNGVALLLFSFFPVLLGMIAAAAAPELAHRELALPWVITQLLPLWLGAILLASVFSAEISSADAILFMLSTSLSKDLYKRFLRPDIDDRRLLRVSRIVVLLSGALGVGAAALLESVIDALTIFYSLMSIALFAPILFGLYSRHPGKRAALAAVLVSVASSFLFHRLTGGAGLGAISTPAFGIALSFLLMGAAAYRSLRRSRQTPPG